MLNLFAHGDHETGLYNNQVGAIGSAAAHFSVNKDPALITMPTGTGKTAVMILLSYVFKAKKVLVITPSQLVRKQIAENFTEPKFLIRNHILSKKHLPRVYELKTEETSKETWDGILARHDVCVAIPATIGTVLRNEAIAADAFDIVFVDEAHHSRANSWASILHYFQKAKQVMLTATPFRRDKKALRARLIYNYPLKQAYEEGLFSKINFIPVKREADAGVEEINIAIAKQTEQTFKHRAHQAHKIIIRTDSKAKAVELSQLYKQYTSLNLVAIHSNLSEKTIEIRITELREGKIDGIICVDMMGEGYDFPSLKIAAIHVPHKSLSITLQFVGRIARTNIAEGKIATVIASEHDIAIDAVELYREDADWSLILPDLHKSRIDLTKEEQEFADTFEAMAGPEEVAELSLPEIPVSLENFLPFFHAKLYRILAKNNNTDDPLIDVFKEIDITGIGVLNNPVIRYSTISKEHQVSLYVIAQQVTPPWLMDSESFQNTSNELVINYYNEDNAILFIGSTVKETELYEYIAQSLLEVRGLHEMIPLPHLKRAMSGWQNEKMYNIGLRSRKTKGNDEAYKQLLGSSVQKGLIPSDTFGYTRGHSFGGAYDTVLKKEVLLGISTSSKVWSLDEKKIVKFIEWCNEIARKVGDPEMDHLSTPLSDLDSGILIEKIPPEFIFFADWDAGFYSKNLMVDFIDEEGTLVGEGLLCSCNISIYSVTEEQIVFTIAKAGNEARIAFSILPVIQYAYTADSPCKIASRQGKISRPPEHILLELKDAPIHVYFEDLSQLIGKVYFESRLSISHFPAEDFLKTDWPADMDVFKEFWKADELAALATGAARSLSIHEHIIRITQTEFDVVYYDHASLEIADVVCMNEGKVRFYHCKKQHSDNPRCDVSDMYEVIGQAVKSAQWSVRKLLMQQLVARADRNGVPAKIRKGSIERIRAILASFDSPVLPIEIIIVQPGLKSTNHIANQADAFNRINILLSGAAEFLKAVGHCDLKVMCS